MADIEKLFAEIREELKVLRRDSEVLGSIKATLSVNFAGRHHECGVVIAQEVIKENPHGALFNVLTALTKKIRSLEGAIERGGLASVPCHVCGVSFVGGAEDKCCAVCVADE